MSSIFLLGQICLHCKAIQIVGFDEDHETNFDTNVCAKKINIQIDDNEQQQREE